MQYSAAATSMCALQCQDCWPQIGNQSVATVTSLTYWVFMSLSRVLQQMLSWCTHHMFHHVLRVWPNKLIPKFGPNTTHTPIFSLSLHNQNIPIPITSTHSLPKSLPCLEPTFTRRMSGHCVGTCRATKCPVTFPAATLQLSNTNICVDRRVCYLLPATIVLRRGIRGGHVN
jgi:hypothetical protein